MKNHLQTAGPGPRHILAWCSVALGCGYQLFETACPTCTTERQLNLPKPVVPKRSVKTWNPSGVREKSFKIAGILCYVGMEVFAENQIILLSEF